MSTQAQANRAIVRDFFETAGAGGDIMAFISEDATWWVPGNWALSGTYSRDDLAPLFGSIFAQLKAPPQFVIHNITAEDDRVAVDCESRAEFNDGSPFGNTYHFLFRLRGGNIVEVKEFLDTHYMNSLNITKS